MKASIYSLGFLTAIALSSCNSDGGNYPEGLPSDLRHQPKDGSLPEMSYKCDTSVVTIHFLGQQPEPGTQMNINQISVAQFNELSPVTVGNEPVTLRLPMEGTNILQIGLNDFDERLGSVWIAPGEDTEIYFDCRPDSVVGDNPRIYTGGTYADLNGLVSRYGVNHIFGPFMPTIGRYDMTDKEYIDNIAQAYNDSLKVIDSAVEPEMIKAIERATLKAALPSFLGLSEFVIRGSYMMSHPESPRVENDSVKLIITPETVKALYEIADFNDTSIQMADIMPLSMGLGSLDWTAGGTQNNLVADIACYRKVAEKAAAGKMKTADRESLAGLQNNAFYLAGVDAISGQYKAKLNEAMKLIKTLPEGTPDNRIVETITAPHKGKVVMIDLWNTWCSPCRAAIAANEPLKSTELSNPDIVWIYVADESSPLPLYVSLIPEIAGEHYRLTENQAEALRKQFDIDGIPYYILTDRQGSYEGRPDLRDHDLFKKAILEKLNAM